MPFYGPVGTDFFKSDLAVSRDGIPQIAYIHNNHYIVYAYPNTPYWTRENLESYNTNYLDITIDQEGKLHLAYSGGENKSQVYASRDLNSWSYQILDLADCVDLDMDLSLAFGKYPSVSNYDQGLAGIILRSQQAADLADQSKPTSPKGRGFELNDYSITGCNQSQDTTNIWDFGAGETATGKTVYHVYAESGAYRVIVQAKTATQTFSKNVVISASYMTFIPFVVVGGVGCVY